MCGSSIRGIFGWSISFKRMKISYSWLQTYFEDELPPAEKLAEMLTLRAYEVERCERAGDDFVLDVDVLPNRAHDSLCHRGIAREAGVLFKIPVKIQALKSIGVEGVKNLHVEIAEPGHCRRYVGRVIENIVVGPSPEWLAKWLEAVGQKSINNIVDAANFVMLDMGQPLHAFDAGRVNGGIVVRNAKQGETIETLDGKRVKLPESMLVVADYEGALAIAGVKGGKRAEIGGDTREIILEAANFLPASIRRTSQEIAMRTESSKRFENEIHPALAERAMRELTALILELSPSAKAGEILDEFPGKNDFPPREIVVGAEEVNDSLGARISQGGIEEILQRLQWGYRKEGEKFFVTPSVERLDLSIKEDIIEEIGRIYGYENISPALPKVSGESARVNKEFFYANKARDILVGLGFSEVETSSFSARGKVAVANPIAEGKGFLRESLIQGILKALELNQKNAPLLGLDAVKIFEIGNVFGEDGEHTELMIAFGKGDVNREVEEFFEAFGAKAEYEVEGGIAVIHFSRLTQDLEVPTLLEHPSLKRGAGAQVKFRKISPYPFIVRDIALFTPEGIAPEEVSAVIEKHAGELLARAPQLFDTFEKHGSGRVSYAFRLAFQSREKTLTDGEANAIMQKISAALGESGWETR